MGAYLGRGERYPAVEAGRAVRLVAELRERLRALVFRPREEREMDEELQTHLQFETERQMASGFDPVEARRRAHIRLGGMERVKEEVRSARGTRALQDAGQDIRYGLRTLRRHPGFTAAVALSLGLGIGATTAIFSLMDAVVWRMLPVGDPQGLWAVGDRFPYDGFLASIVKALVPALMHRGRPTRQSAARPQPRARVGPLAGADLRRRHGTGRRAGRARRRCPAAPGRARRASRGCTRRSINPTRRNSCVARSNAWWLGRVMIHIRRGRPLDSCRAQRLIERCCQPFGLHHRTALANRDRIPGNVLEPDIQRTPAHDGHRARLRAAHVPQVHSARPEQPAVEHDTRGPHHQPSWLHQEQEWRAVDDGGHGQHGGQ